MKHDYNNDTPQADRYAVLVNDKHAHKNTMLSHTHPAEEMGGRYAAEVHSTVVGRDNPIPEYTHAAPWSETQLSDEPPLGYAIDDQEPTGTHAEIQQSLENSNAPNVVVGDESTVPLSVVEGRRSSPFPAAVHQGRRIF
jgi:hypothetical protein